MLATLARCVPQDLVNPFVSAATLPTFGVAGLILWAGALWLLRMLFPRAPAARSIWIAIPPTIAIVPVAGVTLGIWLQARSFIPWCVPINTGVLDAQYYSGTVALVAGWVAFALSLLVVIGSGKAAIVAGRRRS